MEHIAEFRRWLALATDVEPQTADVSRRVDALLAAGEQLEKEVARVLVHAGYLFRATGNGTPTQAQVDEYFTEGWRERESAAGRALWEVLDPPAPRPAASSPYPKPPEYGRAPRDERDSLPWKYRDE